MRIFPKPKEIECPCCKEKISTKEISGIYRCGKCKSEIVENYEPKSQREQLKLFLLIFGTAITTSLYKSVLEPSLFELLVINFLTVAVLWICLRIPIKANLKPKVTYTFVNGLSYPDQQIKKHQELIKWISDSQTDFIGFLRFIVNNSYVVNFVDNKSMNLFKMLNLKTETLPSISQIPDWQSKYIANDLEEVEKIKEKYDSEFKFHIAKLKKMAEGVDYFSE